MTTDSHAVLVELDRLVVQVAQGVSRRGELFGLTPTDWRVLGELSERSGVSLTDLAQTAGIRKGSVSRSLKTLRYYGLVTSNRLEEGNAFVVNLTAKGQEANALARLQGASVSPFNALGERQREVMRELLLLAVAHRPDR